MRAFSFSALLRRRGAHERLLVCQPSDPASLKLEGKSPHAYYTPYYIKRCGIARFVAKLMKKLEARVGIEPTHKGFADLSLTTWVPRHFFKGSATPAAAGCFALTLRSRDAWRSLRVSPAPRSDQERKNETLASRGA